MGSMIISIGIFLIVAAVLMILLMGGESKDKKQGQKVIGCPPGFNPSLAYMEKYGETGIAYDEKQKLLCILHHGTEQSKVLPPANILAAATVEDGIIAAKSVRSDDQGKALMSSLVTEEIQAMFQDSPGESGNPSEETIKPTSQSIDLKLLINDPDHPVQIINFLNMEAKKGGLIYNEASGHAKNWQDLLGFLIRLAGKPQVPASAKPSPQEQSATAPA